MNVLYKCVWGEKKIGEKEKKNLMRVNTQACETKDNKI